MRTADIENELLERYRKIQADKVNEPDWAVHKCTDAKSLVRCTIPFVGKNYSLQSTKILVYASAENLAWYTSTDDLLDYDEKAENRHRICFEENKDSSDFFPNVHINPMNNGCLLTAVYYIAQKLGLVGDVSPRKFYEMIAVANYGKYSIETAQQRALREEGAANISLAKQNNDYAKDPEKLECSHAFISADLEILKPDIIIIPGTIYNTVRDFLKNSTSAKIIDIYQINARVVNCTIARLGRKNLGEISDKWLPESVSNWYENIKGVSLKNYLYVFPYLDKKFTEIFGTKFENK